MKPTDRKPCTPAELLQDFLEGFEESCATIRELMGRHIDKDVAATLADATGTSAEYWLNAQRATDEWEADK